MALKKSELHSSLSSSCDELQNGSDGDDILGDAYSPHLKHGDRILTSTIEFGSLVPENTPDISSGGGGVTKNHDLGSFDRFSNCTTSKMPKALESWRKHVIFTATMSSNNLFHRHDISSNSGADFSLGSSLICLWNRSDVLANAGRC
jgi:hypothetical protein